VIEASRLRRFLSFAEIILIFGLFTLQGAWPAPDVNEAHYLGKAAHFWNPNWIHGDFFLDSADSHKVFYFAFGWLTLWMPLVAVAWTGRILTWLLMAWAWRRMSVAILATVGRSTENASPPPFGWSILTAAIFLLCNERLHMAGEWFIGGVEAKGFAYVLMLLGVESLVKNRWNRAWLLFGASAGVHVLVGGWAVVAAGLAWLFLGSSKTEASPRPKFAAMLPGLLGGFLLSLPGVIPSLALSRNIDPEIVRQANYLYVFERLRHHLDIFQIRIDFLCRFAAMTFGYLILCRMSGRPTGRKDEASEISPSIRILQNFVAGALAIALAGMIVSMIGCFDRVFAAGLLKFYWFRLADIAVPLGVAFMATCWIRQKLAAGSGRGLKWGYAALTLAVAIAVMHFGSYIPVRISPPASRADDAKRIANPAAWREACRWIAEQTPDDARFFTPRLSQTFKWYARRAEVATWKDVPQDAVALIEWWDRIQTVFATGDALPEYRWRENAREMPSDQLELAAKKYDAYYMIAPIAPESDAPPTGWTILHRNAGYAVYQMVQK
jgi:hypothetical protein